MGVRRGRWCFFTAEIGSSLSAWFRDVVPPEGGGGEVNYNMCGLHMLSASSLLLRSGSFLGEDASALQLISQRLCMVCVFITWVVRSCDHMDMLQGIAGCLIESPVRMESS